MTTDNPSPKKRPLSKDEKQECATLKRIYSQKKSEGLAVSHESIGAELGISQGAVSHYLNGINALNSRVASVFSRQLMVPVSDFSGRLSKEISAMAAPVSQSNTGATSSRSGRVPLISNTQVSSWLDAANANDPPNTCEWRPAPPNHSARSYAIRVPNCSMEPRFREGEDVVIDPEADIISGKFVAAREAGAKEVVLKQIIIEGNQRYLRALNPHWPDPIIRLNDNWTLYGRVICKIELV